LGHREYHLANTFLFLFLVLPYYYLIVTQVSRLGNLELMKLMRMPLIYILSSSWVRGFVSRRNYRSDHLWNHGNSITEGAPAMPRCVASIEKKGGGQHSPAPLVRVPNQHDRRWRHRFKGSRRRGRSEMQHSICC
jgi:hypothetical protein